MTKSFIKVNNWLELNLKNNTLTHMNMVGVIYLLRACYSISETERDYLLNKIDKKFNTTERYNLERRKTKR